MSYENTTASSAAMRRHASILVQRIEQPAKVRPGARSKGKRKTKSGLQPEERSGLQKRKGINLAKAALGIPHRKVPHHLLRAFPRQTAIPENIVSSQNSIESSQKTDCLLCPFDWRKASKAQARLFQRKLSISILVKALECCLVCRTFA